MTIQAEQVFSNAWSNPLFVHARLYAVRHALATPPQPFPRSQAHVPSINEGARAYAAGSTQSS